jgi:hypothetical protein
MARIQVRQLHVGKSAAGLLESSMGTSARIVLVRGSTVAVGLLSEATPM